MPQLCHSIPTTTCKVLTSCNGSVCNCGNAPITVQWLYICHIDISHQKPRRQCHGFVSNVFSSVFTILSTCRVLLQLLSAKVVTAWFHWQAVPASHWMWFMSCQILHFEQVQTKGDFHWCTTQKLKLYKRWTKLGPLSVNWQFHGNYLPQWGNQKQTDLCFQGPRSYKAESAVLK